MIDYTQRPLHLDIRSTLLAVLLAVMHFSWAGIQFLTPVVNPYVEEISKYTGNRVNGE